MIRPETAADQAAIRRVHELAFGQPHEADLVDALRAAGDAVPELSLVAVADDALGHFSASVKPRLDTPPGGILGHIVFSRIHIGPTPALALAPLAVLPARQNEGIGTALVRAGLDACRQAGYGLVVVQGHPEYYPRFGFVPARPRGIESPFAVPDPAFMVCELLPGALAGVAGMVRYAPAFAAF